ncbi:MAG: hypothetical protein HYX66_08675 [Ignavibacteria bacterium]|nr:hypothetical protein [Ignavibacteria bacterium]
MSVNVNEKNASSYAEREKTKRYFALLGVGGTIILIVVLLFFSKVGKGELTVGKDGFTVKIDRPLIEQVHTQNAILKTGGDQIPYTTGKIADSLIRQIELKNSTPITPERFLGNNLIDKKAGFVLASSDPGQWSIKFDEGGYVDMQRNIVELNSAGGATVKISRTPTSAFPNCKNVKCVVEFVANILVQAGEAPEYPDVSYDEPSGTALLTFRNRDTQGETFIKIIQKGEYWYEATTDYNSALTSEKTRKDAQKIVTSFSVTS